MAKVESGSPLAGVTGTVGELITYKRQGVQVVRSRPSKGKKRKPSPLQKLHIASFKAQHAVASSVKRNLIDRIWSLLPLKGGMNPYNEFIKVNRPAYGQTDYVAFPELMVISKGSLLPARGFMAKQEGENLRFTWEIGFTGKNASLADRLNLVVLSSQRSLKIIEVDARRKNGSAIIPLPDSNNGFTEGYAFWSSENYQSFSPSIYWVCR